MVPNNINIGYLLIRKVTIKSFTQNYGPLYAYKCRYCKDPFHGNLPGRTGNLVEKITLLWTDCE